MYKNVLFVCRGNVGRSQFAEALYKKYSGLEAISAGTKVPQDGPGQEGKMLKDIPVAEPVIKCLQEKEDLDISTSTNKQIIPSILNGVDKIVIMAEKETVPIWLANDCRATYWSISDPLNKSYLEYCKTMEEIKKLVLSLISEAKNKL